LRWDDEMPQKNEIIVRKKLEEIIGVLLPKRRLVVGYDAKGFPKTHEFDLVSDDGKIVGEIKSSKSISETSYKAALVDCLYLAKIRANRRMLVLTDEEFLRYFKRRAGGLISPEIDVMLIRTDKSV